MSIRGRKFCKTNLTRPKKGGGKKRRRQNEQRNRLIGLGVAEEEVAKMNSREILTALQRPLKVIKAVAAAKGE